MNKNKKLVFKKTLGTT